MQVDDFNVFIVFAKHLNFSHAAMELNMTQPTLSKRIAAMERELGVTLVRRSRPLELTEEGRLFLESAQRIKRVMDQEMSSFKAALSKGYPVRLLGFDYSPCERLLSSMRDIPVTFALETGEESAFVRVANSSVDIATAPDYSQSPELVKRAKELSIEMKPIGELTLAILVMKKNPLAQLDEITRSDLKGARLAMVARGMYDDWGRYLIHYLGDDLGLSLALESIDGNMRNLGNIDFEDTIYIMDRNVIDSISSSRDDVKVFHTLDGVEPLLPLVIIWRSDNPNPNVRAFVERVSTPCE